MFNPSFKPVIFFAVLSLWITLFAALARPGISQATEITSLGDYIPSEARTGVQDIYLGTYQNHAAAVLRSVKKLLVWGRDEFGQSSGPNENITDVMQVALGDYHTVVLLANGTALAWGEPHSTFTSSLDGVSAVAAGCCSSMVLFRNGTVAVYGNVTAPPDSIQGKVVNITIASAGAPDSNHQPVREAEAGPDGTPTVPSLACSAMFAVLNNGSLVGWGTDRPAKGPFIPSSIRAARVEWMVGGLDGIGGVVLNQTTTQSGGMSTSSRLVSWWNPFTTEGAAVFDDPGPISGVHVYFDGIRLVFANGTSTVFGGGLNELSGRFYAEAYTEESKYGGALRKALGDEEYTLYLLSNGDVAAVGTMEVPVAAATNVTRLPASQTSKSTSWPPAAGTQLGIGSLPSFQTGAESGTDTEGVESDVGQRGEQDGLPALSPPESARPPASSSTSAPEEAASGNATPAVSIVPLDPITTTTTTGVRPSGSVQVTGTISLREYVPPAARRGVKDIYLSTHHKHAAAVLHKDSKLVVWGQDEFGQASGPNMGLTDVLQVALGDYHTVVLLANGTALAWGEPHSIFTSSLDGVSAVAAGCCSSMVLFRNGTMAVYGNVTAPPGSIQGMVVNITIASSLNTESGAPARTVELGPDRQPTLPSLACSAMFAVLNNGSLVGWGTNKPAKGPFIPSSIRAARVEWMVGGLHGLGAMIVNTTTSSQGTSVINVTRKLLVWWDPFSVSPGAVFNDPGPISGIYTYRDGLRVVSPNGIQTHYWEHFDGLEGRFYQGQEVATSKYGDALRKAVGAQYETTGDDSYTLFLLDSGVVDAVRDISVPVVAPSSVLSRAVNVVASTYNIHVLLEDRTLISFGSGYETPDVPAAVLKYGCVDVASRSHDMCLLPTGSVVSWGNSNFQVDIVPEVTRFNTVQIAAGLLRGHALLLNGTVIDWGWGVYDPPYTSNVAQIAASDWTVVARLQNGTVREWGPDALVLPEFLTSGAVNVTYVAAAGDGRAALLSNGTVVFWQNYGQIVLISHGFETATKIALYFDDGDALRFYEPRNLTIARAYILLANGTLMMLNETRFLATGQVQWHEHPKHSPPVLDVACDATYDAVIVSSQPADTNSTTPLAPQREGDSHQSGAGIGLLIQEGTGQIVSDKPNGSQGGSSHWSTSARAVAGITVAAVLVAVAVAAAATFLIRRHRFAINFNGADDDDDNDNYVVRKEAGAVHDRDGAAADHTGKGGKGAGRKLHLLATFQDTDAHTHNRSLPDRTDQGIELQVRDSFQKRGNHDHFPELALPGVSEKEVFARETALAYTWSSTALPGPGLGHEHDEYVAVEAGVNDVQLDRFVKSSCKDRTCETGAALEGAVRNEAGQRSVCPVVKLSKQQVVDNIRLLQDGLLGRGATAMVFKCVWPERFGPKAVLAAKVLKDGYESTMPLLQSFCYEAGVLANSIHPNIVRLYGYCLEPPNVCLILELLPISLKDLLYKPVSMTPYRPQPSRADTLPGNADAAQYKSSCGTSAQHPAQLLADTNYITCIAEESVTRSDEDGSQHVALMVADDRSHSSGHDGDDYPTGHVHCNASVGRYGSERSSCKRAVDITDTSPFITCMAMDHRTVTVTQQEALSAADHNIESTKYMASLRSKTMERATGHNDAMLGLVVSASGNMKARILMDTENDCEYHGDARGDSCSDSDSDSDASLIRPGTMMSSMLINATPFNFGADDNDANSSSRRFTRSSRATYSGAGCVSSSGAASSCVPPSPSYWNATFRRSTHSSSGTTRLTLPTSSCNGAQLTSSRNTTVSGGDMDVTMTTRLPAAIGANRASHIPSHDTACGGGGGGGGGHDGEDTCTVHASDAGGVGSFAKPQASMHGVSEIVTQDRPREGLQPRDDDNGNNTTDDRHDVDTWLQAVRSANMTYTGQSTTCSQLTLQQVLQIGCDVSAGLSFLHNRLLQTSSGAAAAYPCNGDGGGIHSVSSMLMSQMSQLGMLSVPSVLAGQLSSGFIQDMDEAIGGSRVVHRDLKPGNVLINSRGVAKISDFGLAREHQQTTLHTVHLAAGTLPYMAPELLCAVDASNASLPATNKVDVYSLGMMMWEMLSGAPPWKGSSEAALIAAVVGGQRPPLPANTIRPSNSCSSYCMDHPLHTPTLSEPQQQHREAMDQPANLTSSPELNQLIRQCWQLRAHKRPTAAAVHEMMVHLMQQHADMSGLANN